MLTKELFNSALPESCEPAEIMRRADLEGIRELFMASGTGIRYLANCVSQATFIISRGERTDGEGEGKTGEEGVWRNFQMCEREGA